MSTKLCGTSFLALSSFTAGLSLNQMKRSMDIMTASNMPSLMKIGLAFVGKLVLSVIFSLGVMTVLCYQKF